MGSNPTLSANVMRKGPSWPLFCVSDSWLSVNPIVEKKRMCRSGLGREICSAVASGCRHACHLNDPYRRRTLIGQCNILAHEYGQVDHALCLPTAHRICWFSLCGQLGEVRRDRTRPQGGALRVSVNNPWLDGNCLYMLEMQTGIAGKAIECGLQRGMRHVPVTIIFQEPNGLLGSWYAAEAFWWKPQAILDNNI